VVAAAPASLHPAKDKISTGFFKAGRLSNVRASVVMAGF
jgi:hypothetical protein